MKTVRMIDAMYRYYGRGTGICGNCPHLKHKFFDRYYYKCSVYGDSNSEATDWKKSYFACGLIDKPFPESDRRIVELVGSGRKEEEPLQGQMSWLQ